MRIATIKAFFLVIILLSYFNNCLSQIKENYKIPDSIIKEVIESIYPEKSYLKIKIEELPSKILSKFNWENDNDRSLVLYVSKFDSTFIEQQLAGREIIIIDSIINRRINEPASTKNDFISIHYILFSKDMKRVIIKEQHYCGEDCGREQTTLYKKKKREWVFEKGIIGGIY